MQPRPLPLEVYGIVESPVSPGRQGKRRRLRKARQAGNQAIGKGRRATLQAGPGQARGREGADGEEQRNESINGASPRLRL
ncbi:hypothetical protein Mapa_006141 [Marchantia paleacea]|nr:hypothetical protein Mapa_006141 [Marchantia paleacea]